MEFVALGIWFIFQPRIPVLPAGFSQVLASISLGSCEEKERGLQGLGGEGKGDSAGVCHTQLSTAGEMEGEASNMQRCDGNVCFFLRRLVEFRQKFPTNIQVPFHA